MCVCCGMFTKGGPPSLTVNRLRDPAGLPPRPTLASSRGLVDKMTFFFPRYFQIRVTVAALGGMHQETKVMRRGFPSEKELSCSCCKSRNICCVDCKATFTIFSKTARQKDLKSPSGTGTWSVIEERVRMIVLMTVQRKKRVNVDTANAIC